MSGWFSKLKKFLYTCNDKILFKQDKNTILADNSIAHWLVYEQQNNCKFISTVCVTCNLLWKSYLIARRCRAHANNYNYSVSAFLGVFYVPRMCRVHLKILYFLEYIKYSTYGLKIFRAWHLKFFTSTRFVWDPP